MVELAGHWSHCGRHLSMTIKVWSCCHACRCVLWNVRLLRTSPSPTPSAGVELESCCLTRSARSFALHSPPPRANCLHLYAKGGALRRLRLMTIRGVFDFAIYEARND